MTFVNRSYPQVRLPFDSTLRRESAKISLDEISQATGGIMARLRASAMLIGASLLWPVPALLAQPGPSGPPTAPVLPLEYAVKLVCGRTPDENAGAFVPGAYATAINVHNPARENGIVVKVALAGPGRPGPMTPFSREVRLRYDEALEFDCRVAGRLLEGAHVPVPAFFTGFLVIEARSQLDVVAVYTAGAPGGPVASIHTERVPVRSVR